MAAWSTPHSELQFAATVDAQLLSDDCCVALCAKTCVIWSTPHSELQFAATFTTLIC
jgi:hypothetical protein